jgi:hypothetical protein
MTKALVLIIFKGGGERQKEKPFLQADDLTNALM